MLALHAGFTPPHLILWAESSNQSGKRRKGLRSHPLDAGMAQLSEALASLGLQTPRKDFTTVPVWLPSAEQEPLPSTRLLRDFPDAEVVNIAQWEISAAPLNPEEALELLCFCVNKELLHPGMVAGADLSYWSTAMRF